MTSSSAGAPDLRTVCNELEEVALKACEIGIQLGIPRSKLLKLKQGENFLTAVIDHWLRGNVPTTPVSWMSLVGALKSEQVGEVGLAEHICRKYCSHQDKSANDSAKMQNKGEFLQGDESSAAEGKQSQTPTRDGEMDPKVKMDLEFILEKNLKEIITLYASYVDCVCECVEEKGITPEKLRRFLLSLPAFMQTYKGQQLALLSDKKKELDEAKTITEIFKFLTTECASFLNYDIFRAVLKKYSISADREDLKYDEYLKNYIEKHKITEFTRINPFLKPKSGSTELLLKFDVEKTCRLAKIVELEKSIANILGIYPSALHVFDIKDGCVILSYLIPTFIANALFTPDTVFTLQQDDEFRAASVLWLQCNGYTFNFKEKHSVIAKMDSEEEDGEISLEEQFLEGAKCQNCRPGDCAIAYCHTCKRLLCDECLAFHRKQIDTYEHCTVESPKAEDLKQLYKCQHHGDNMLDYFCKSCHKPICQDCQVTTCKGHDFLVLKDIKKEMTKLLEQVKAKKEQFAHHAEYIEEKITQNADAFNQCEAEINTTFDTLFEELKSNRANLSAQLQCVTEKHDERVKQHQEHVSDKIKMMETTIAQTENLLSTKMAAKLMINYMELCANLDGQASLEWSRHAVTFRSWHLNHKDQKELAANFSQLLPKPTRESITVSDHEKAYVGVKNTFTITADISDQFEAYDKNLVNSFVSVMLQLTPTDKGDCSIIDCETTREDNVWTVTYSPQQHGRVSIEVSVCGVKAWEEPFMLTTEDPSFEQKESKLKKKKSLTKSIKTGLKGPKGHHSDA